MEESNQSEKNSSAAVLLLYHRSEISKLDHVKFTLDIIANHVCLGSIKLVLMADLDAMLNISNWIASFSLYNWKVLKIVLGWNKFDAS